MTLERLEIKTFPNIIRDILQERRSGILTVVGGNARRLIHWAYGDLVLVESDRPEEMLQNFLRKKDLISDKDRDELQQIGSRNVVLHFTEVEMVPSAGRHSVLREWISSVVGKLFPLDTGTALFEDSDPLAPEQRVFLSTPALVLEGIRSIQSGLVLRNSLGDLKRKIEPVADPPFEIETLPLTDEEREVIKSVSGPTALQEVLKNSPTSSVVSSRTAIAMFTFGLWRDVVERPVTEGDFDATQRDMQILAAISGDQKALRVVALSRQMERMDHYSFLDVPRAATRTQIVMKIEQMQQQYVQEAYAPAAREAVTAIRKRLEEAANLLGDTDRRHAYDELLSSRGAGASNRSLEQQAARRSLARQNFRKAEELFLKGDYHTSIVLLTQAVTEGIGTDDRDQQLRKPVARRA
ncbi:MAG: DUF4388 domain-containing protein [Acidobacteria bacterium]|nr:DUF4388 domain-containing protein [Acidobacteriota bacterium]